jgi:DNA-binding CsgD family transcriptional regulator
MTSHKKPYDKNLSYSAKAEQALMLMSASFDLINGEATTEEWLTHFAALANSASVLCLRWPAGKPEQAIESVVGDRPALPSDWKNRTEWIITVANPSEPNFVDDIAASAGLISAEDRDSAFGQDIQIACIDWFPARIIIVLAQRKSDPLWTDIDRARLKSLLPLLRKSVLSHKKMARLTNALRLTNQILSELKRASFSLSIEAAVSSRNQLAQDILDNGTELSMVGSKLSFNDTETQAKFEQQLQIISILPRDQLPSYTWHIKLPHAEESETLLVTLRAYFLEDWAIEANTYDRVVVLHIERMGAASQASIPKLCVFYDLTNSQARLVASLLNGENIESAANTMHVSINTARSHLRTIYSKLGVNSRSQLLQKLTATTVD